MPAAGYFTATGDDTPYYFNLCAAITTITCDGAGPSPACIQNYGQAQPPSLPTGSCASIGTYPAATSSSVGDGSNASLVLSYQGGDGGRSFDITLSCSPTLTPTTPVMSANIPMPTLAKSSPQHSAHETVSSTYARPTAAAAATTVTPRYTTRTPRCDAPSPRGSGAVVGCVRTFIDPNVCSATCPLGHDAAADGTPEAADCGGEVYTECGSSCPRVCGQPMGACNMMCGQGLACPSSLAFNRETGQCEDDSCVPSGGGGGMIGIGRPFMSAMAAEESYEDRQKRLKEAEKKRRAEKRSKRFKNS